MTSVVENDLPGMQRLLQTLLINLAREDGEERYNKLANFAGIIGSIYGDTVVAMVGPYLFQAREDLKAGKNTAEHMATVNSMVDRAEIEIGILLRACVSDFVENHRLPDPFEERTLT